MKMHRYDDLVIPTRGRDAVSTLGGCLGWMLTVIICFGSLALLLGPYVNFGDSIQIIMAFIILILSMIGLTYGSIFGDFCYCWLGDHFGFDYYKK